MNITSDKYLYFRDDDAAILSEKLIKLIDIFLSNDLPLHLAVIPGQLSSECSDYLRNLIKKYPNMLEIGQHGYMHKNYSTQRTKHKKYEFGVKRSFIQQEKDLLTGNRTLTKSFNSPITVFTPPWHGFNQSTLDVLTKHNFSAISLGNCLNNQLYKSINLKCIPIHINFNKRADNGSWFTENNVTIIKEIIKSPSQEVGILLHHEKFNSDKEFKQLNKLLKYLKSFETVKFKVLSQASGARIKNANLDREAVAYFLNYQFVPKPYKLTQGSDNPLIKQYDYSKIKFNNTIIRSNLSEILYSSLKKSVRKYLPLGNAPIGLLLSGGIDSAILLHLLRDLTDRPIFTLTAAFSKGSPNLRKGQLLSKTYGSNHHELIIQSKDLRIIDELYSFGVPQPIGDNGFLSTYLMFKYLNQFTRHIYSGDGADCLFSGLKMHQKYFNGNNDKKNCSVYEHYQYGETFLTEKDLESIFTDTILIDLQKPVMEAKIKCHKRNLLKRQVCLDLNFLVKNRVDYILYAAKASNSLALLPYLDKPFVQTIAGISEKQLKDSSEINKMPLRSAFNGKLPKSILNGKSEGFTPPFKDWYQDNFRFVIKQLVKSSNLGISKKYIKYLMENIKHSNKYLIGMKIWLLINLVSWQEARINSK